MDLRAADHAERCRLLAAETARVGAWLRSLEPADLDGPAVGDWTRRDVVAHLVVVANFYAGNIERGAAGDVAAPEGRPPAGSMRGATAAAGVRSGAAAVAASTADDPLGAFDRSATRLGSRLADLSEEQLDLPGYHPGGLLPLNRFLFLRAKELCVHEWDLRAPTEPDARISDLGVAAVLQIIDENIASGSLRWAYRPDPTVEGPLHVAVSLDHPVRWRAGFTVTGDSVDMDPTGGQGPDAAVDATITGDAEVFVRVVYGRADPTVAHAEGTLVFDPPSLAARFGSWFTGI
ncbi:MAG: maleylpyruvate isomerase N-terminal domain-containing protein [Acidimicrobiales bacterium]|nr:maleylpyruvate isomerase N-terminal domain-containing protein [Acidimicrobiales bacterium]